MEPIPVTPEDRAMLDNWFTYHSPDRKSVV